MKRIITLIALLSIALRSYGVQAAIKDEQKCNDAINQTAIHLREQSALSMETEELRKFSRSEVEQMIDISNRIIRQCEVIISHCDLNREMTEGIVDLIIDNKEKTERLSSDTVEQRQLE